MMEMDLNNALVDFINRLKYASHILPLLENESISVRFCPPDQHNISILIDEKDLQIAQADCESDMPLLIICGDYSSLLQLVEGRTKLQVLQRRGDITVEGKYRYILKMESLLYCCSFETMPIQINKIEIIV